MLEDTLAMLEERTEPRWSGAPEPTRFRLAWRWKESGTTGRGPWMHREDVVEAWMESLNARFADNVEHWIERSAGAD